MRPTGPVRLIDQAAGTVLELQLTPPLDLVVLYTRYAFSVADRS
ncbi:MAG: hypothetical protein ACKOYK_00810 [Cyanobium sp.]